MKRNIAVILAGGVGSRLGMSTPKQFFKVAGKMVVEHTVDVFERNQRIDEIAIVANPMLISDFENIVLRNKWRKVKKILKGGKERYDSSLSAIQAYSNQDVNLIFHDAVRPLVSQRIVNDVIDALSSHRAIDVAIPSADTIIEVDSNECITSIPDRSRLRRGQTPQAFDRQLIADAYERALKDPEFKTTDDCGVVRKYTDEPVFVVRGEESNMKLTYREDTYMLDKLFQLKNTEPESIEHVSDVFRDKVAVVFGGSYGIGKYVVEMLRESGAKVFSYSRSENKVDVAQRDSVAKAMTEAHEEAGRIDYVVCTAGVLNKEPLASMDYETIQNAVQTNYLGTVNVALEAYPYLKQTEGKLIFFTSSSYTRGRAFYSIYSSTKAAIVNFVQAVAQEWDGDGIKINCINPERTKTPMRQQNFGIEPDDSLLMPERVAEATLQTLASDCTGQVIDVRRQKE